ncbi:MAG: GNAT family N-acetyltransferase [Byssovorax sp.]
MIPGFSRDALIHEILIAPQGALLPLPDTRITERPGFFQVVTPQLTRGGLNEIICGALPEEDADAFLDRAIRPYDEHGLAFRWTLPPGPTQPADLAERLMLRGLTPSESLGLARLIGDDLPPDAPSVTAREIGLDAVDDFTRVMAEGWEMDPGPLDDMHRRMLADPRRNHRLFVAYDGSVAAGAAGYILLDRSAYLLGAVVLPAHRGRGLYRALVRARMMHALAQGVPLATSFARAETSAPILRGLGFEPVCTLRVFSR